MQMNTLYLRLKGRCVDYEVLVHKGTAGLGIFNRTHIDACAANKRIPFGDGGIAARWGSLDSARSGAYHIITIHQPVVNLRTVSTGPTRGGGQLSAGRVVVPWEELLDYQIRALIEYSRQCGEKSAQSSETVECQRISLIA